MEKKYLLAPFEIEETKEIETNGQKFGVVKGFASTFGNVDRGGDRVLKGAFDETLAKHAEQKKQIKMMSDHWDLIGGFPTFSTTAKGLKVEGNINLEVQKGIETYSLAKQGVVTDMSIGYRSVDIQYVTEKIGEKDGVDINASIRNIKRLDLYEVSLVAFPMNDQANISSIKSCKSITDVSKFLKEKGISNRESNEIIYFIKSLSRNDDEEGEARNEVFDKIDNLKTVQYLDEVINKIKRSA